MATPDSSRKTGKSLNLSGGQNRRYCIRIWDKKLSCFSDLTTGGRKKNVIGTNKAKEENPIGHICWSPPNDIKKRRKKKRMSLILAGSVIKCKLK